MPNEIRRKGGVYKSPEIDASIRKEKKRIQNRIAYVGSLIPSAKHF